MNHASCSPQQFHNTTASYDSKGATHLFNPDHDTLAPPAYSPEPSASSSRLNKPANPSSPYNIINDSTTPTQALIPTRLHPGLAPVPHALDVPSHRLTLTSSFLLPASLASIIFPHEWSAFTCQLTQLARLSGRQWTTNITLSFAFFVVMACVSGIGIVAAVPLSYIYRNKRERENFARAVEDGRVGAVVEGWNQVWRMRGVVVEVEEAEEGVLWGVKGKGNRHNMGRRRGRIVVRRV